ncbi:MAG TPA: hypothetical protein VL738_04955 [Dactylosporangium sp.]|nr:hypothetical protein [Dactylosporangium sp.]
MIDVAPLRAAIDRVALLLDPPDETALRAALGELPATVRCEPARASFSVYSDSFGCRCDLFDLPDDEFEEAERRLYDGADEAAASIAAALDLPPAGPLDVVPHLGYGDAVRLRAGHWVVSVAVRADGDDVPVFVEVCVEYGAGLDERLLSWAPPPAYPPAPVDWSAAGAQPPAEYRWLLERYGLGTFGSLVTLSAPGPLRPASAKGFLRLDSDATLPVATAGGTTTLAYVVASPTPSVRVHFPDGGDGDTDVGLLQFLVALLCGNATIPGRPSPTPGFSPAPGDGP